MRILLLKTYEIKMTLTELKSTHLSNVNKCHEKIKIIVKGKNTLDTLTSACVVHLILICIFDSPTFPSTARRMSCKDPTFSKMPLYTHSSSKCLSSVYSTGFYIYVHVDTMSYRKQESETFPLREIESFTLCS